MKIFTKQIVKKLKKNHEKYIMGTDRSMELMEQKPVVKVFNPMGSATWLLSSLDEEGRLFGLCDLGMGFPEIGFVLKSEIEQFSNSFGLGLERDKFFNPEYTLIEYTDIAREKGRIVA